MLKLLKLDFGSANLILAVLLISLGLFWVAWSRYSVLTFGKGHAQRAIGESLAPSTVRLGAIDAFEYAGNPMVLGYLIVLVGVAESGVA